jgi:hypothetical protein
VTGSTNFGYLGFGGTVNFNGNVVNVGDSLIATAGTANFKNSQGTIATKTITINRSTIDFSHTAGVVNTIQLTLNNFGTLSGSSTVAVSGQLNWTSGIMSGSGSTNIAVGAVMNLSGNSEKVIDGRVLNNSGAAIWTGAGGIRCNNGPVFNNLNGATFNAENDAIIFWGGLGAFGAFNNAGTFRKRVATGATTFNRIACTNSGTVDMQNGTLSLDNRYTQTQTPTGALNIYIGGTTGGTQFSRVMISGTPAPAATLNGTLKVDLVNPFMPSIGNSFQIMTFSTRETACFDPIILPPLPAGLRWQVDCTGTMISAGSLTLSVVPGVQ